MTRLILLWVWALGLSLTGCNRSADESLDEFTKRWDQAVSQQAYEPLYDMLQTRSQRKIRQDLDALRGLDSASQASVLAQLGQNNASGLKQLKPQRYFAWLWGKATSQQRPQVQVNARGSGAAEMTLTFEGQKKLQIKLFTEGGRWTWQLPEQQSMLDYTDHE